MVEKIAALHREHRATGADISDRTNETLAEMLRQKDALYQLTDRLQRAQSLDDVYDAALHAILSALPCDRASILLFDDADVMRFVAWRGLSPAYRKVVEGHSPWPRDEKNPAPICVNDVETAGLDAALTATIRTEGIGAAAFVPLMSDGRLIGKFMTYFNAPHVFGGDEIELSLHIARQLAFAIERRRADEALRRSEQSFRQMIDALPAAIYTTDAKGRLTHFNPAAVEFSGRVPELGRDEWCVSWKLYWPDGTFMPHAQCPMAVALKEGRTIRGAEAIAERPDGARRWFTPFPTPLYDDNKRIVGGINMLLDITERKRTEQLLAEELEATQWLHNLSTEMVQSDDIDALYQRIMDTAVSIMDSQYASMQMLYPERGKGGELRLLAFRGFNPETAKFWEWVRADSPCACGEALRVGKRVVVADVEKCEFMAGTPDQKTALQTGIHAVQSTPLVSREGKLLGMISTHWREPHQPSERDLRLFDILARQAADLIERKQAEDALRRSEARYRNVFQTVQVSIWEEDFSEVKLAIDALKAAGVSDFRGYFAEHPDFVAKAIRSVRILDINDATVKMFGASDKRQLLDSLDTIFVPETAGVFAEELLAIAEGRTFFEADEVLRSLQGERLEVQVSIVFPAPHESFDRVLVTVMDITERKKAEQGLREADRRKDEFLATLSHELRNPLAPVRQAAKLLQSPQLSERDAHWARDVIDRQVAVMGWLLDDLLDMSRISSGKLELRKEPVDLASVVESALELARPLIDAKQHILHTELPAEPLWLEADPLRLAQIISNLLTNAAKYTDSKGEIRLRACREGKELAVHVSDNGIGISAEMLPKIFEMFSQAAPMLERTEGGLGVGLALVHGFAALHGGSIQARSEGLGKGSEFTLCLPLGAVSGNRLQKQPAAADVGPVTGRKVLVVDDNRDAAETLSTLIRLYGCEVRTSFNGSEALEVAEIFQPDIALLDIGMPGLNGYEMAQQIRQRLWGKRTRLIAITGWGQEDDKRRAIAAGFDYHLRKPIDSDSLRSLLQNGDKAVS